MALIDFFTNPTNAAEMVALLVSLFTLARKQAGYWWWFCPFLAVTVGVEALGYWFRVVLHLPNYGLYNFFMLVQVLFFTMLFYRFQHSKQVQLLLLLACATFVLFLLGESIIDGFKAYCKYSRQLLSILMVLFSCIFYFSLLQFDSIPDPTKYAPFWIVTGLFFYYFGTIAIFCFYSTVSQIKLSGNISFYNLVMGCLNAILYGSWIIGFLCRKKQTTISTPS